MIKLRASSYPAHPCTTSSAPTAPPTVLTICSLGAPRRCGKTSGAAPVRRCARVKQRRETGKHAARLKPSCIYSMISVQQIVGDNNNGVAMYGVWSRTAVRELPRELCKS